VRVWDVQQETEIARAACPITALATASSQAMHEYLLIAHYDQGISMWSLGTSAKDRLPQQMLETAPERLRTVHRRWWTVLAGKLRLRLG
jgi:hypothetical protein